MAAAKNLSLIAKFDELCRGFNHLIGDSHHGKALRSLRVAASTVDACFYRVFFSNAV